MIWSLLLGAVAAGGAVPETGAGAVASGAAMAVMAVASSERISKRFIWAVDADTAGEHTTPQSRVDQGESQGG